MTRRSRRRVLLTHIHGWPDVRRGAERYLHELAAALTETGHDVDVMVSGPVPQRTHVLGARVRRVRPRHVPGRLHLGATPADAGFGVACLPRGLFGRYDVWHATSLGDGVMAAAAGTVRPRLVSVFTDHGFPVRTSRGPRGDHRLFELLTRRIDAYVCVSEPAADCLARDYGRTAVVVPPGVDLRRFTPGSGRDERPLLLFAAALDEPRKNLPLFLGAMATVLAARADARIALLGDGDVTALLAAAPPAVRDAVMACGPVAPEDMPGWYRRAWATVLPSDAEVFGMTVVESFACGTPVVVLDDGLGPAGLVDRPLTGVRSRRDAAALGDACLAALDVAADPATREACVAAAKPYDWVTGVVPRLEEVYAGAG